MHYNGYIDLENSPVSYYGIDNYKRLIEIKKKYDPLNNF